MKSNDKIPFMNQLMAVIERTQCERTQCGRGAGQRFTTEIAQKLVVLNNQNWARLSLNRLAIKLVREGVNVSPVTV